MQDDIFEWDDEKERANVRKHGVRFSTAAQIFDDPFIASITDHHSSRGERRIISIGNANNGRTYVVVHTQREIRTRIIQARIATPRERKWFMNETFDQLREDEDHFEMLPEYDFSNAVRGRYYTGRKRTVYRVSLDEDVAEHFVTNEAVNEALRMLIAEGRVPLEH